MNTINAQAHILTDEGKNASGVSISLEVYVLSSRRWIKMVTAKSNAKGIWKATTTQLQKGTFYAPTLRLTEPGNPAPRVLSQGGYISYNTTKKVFTIDFGTIERLEEVAYPLKASSSVFSRSRLIVAGQAKKSKISIVNILRNNSSGAIFTRGVNPTIATNLPTSTTDMVSAAESIRRSPILDNFDAEILKFNAKEANLRSTIVQKDNLLQMKNLELSTSKLELKKVKEKLGKAEEKEKVLKKQNEIFVNEASRKTSIQDIAANIGTQVDNANKKLEKDKRAYRFGRIELDLRGTVSTDGQKMTLASLVDLKELGASASLPGIKVEILPETTGSEITEVKVPKVTGLTETAVRRLLQAVGLQFERIDKTVESNEDIAIGQSIQQSPAAGTELQRGGTVLVVFTAQATLTEDK